MENTAKEETDLLAGAAGVLRDRLPSTWEVSVGAAAAGDPPRAVDATIVLKTPNGSGTVFAVAVRQTLAPRDVSTVWADLGRSLRGVGGSAPLLVVAPWIGQRAQELLTAERIGYVDLTGNVRVQLDYPTLFLSTVGAARDPARPRGRARVRGPKAGRLIRTLVDAVPPYGVRDLAEATDLAPGYVSQMLQTLDREALITRSARGGVESVEIGALLRRWAETYDVLKSNTAQAFVSSAGVARAYGDLVGAAAETRVAVTGSFAAVRLAPVAAPALLLAYCDDADEVARRLRLLPADYGADVVLLEPFDPVVWAGVREHRDGVTEVAPTQVAADCLTGVGRMPAEGEAVLGWLASSEAWHHSLDELVFPRSVGSGGDST